MTLASPSYDSLMPVMDELLLAYSRLHRLSGSDDAERAASLLVETLRHHGLDARLESCPLLLSDPLEGSLTLADFPAWRVQAKTRSFSAHCPQG